MRVAFVCSGNKGIAPLVTAQANSLIAAGVDIQFVPILGKGLAGYLKAIPDVKKRIDRLQPDLVHAHYSLSGIVSCIACRKPIVTSLMGSDSQQSKLMKIVLSVFINWLWGKTIVKSEDMKNRLGARKIVVIPNGVNLDLFKPLDIGECRTQLGWSMDKKHIVFVSNANSKRPEKNLDLTLESLKACNRDDLELHIIEKVPHTDIPIYLNAANLLLLTSKWEGSPNIVKEAMACNVPVVATDVGDIRWLFGQAPGLKIAEADVIDIAQKILSVLAENSRSAGRERIIALNLDSPYIATKLVDIYNGLINDA